MMRCGVVVSWGGTEWWVNGEGDDGMMKVIRYSNIDEILVALNSYQVVIRLAWVFHHSISRCSFTIAKTGFIPWVRTGEGLKPRK